MRSVTNLLAITVLFTCGLARAQEPPLAEAYQSPFGLNWQVDAPVMLISSALWGIPVFASQELPQGSCYPCDSGNVNSLDRTTINFYNENASIASDVVLGIFPAAALGLTLVSLGDQGGWSAIFEDVVLLAETMVITGMTAQIAKHAFGRPRPYMYQNAPGDSRRKRSSDDVSSFYSAHTSLAFAAATSMSYLFSVRHPQKRARYIIWVASLAAASSVAALRVFSGKHFLTDVTAGAVVGGATGILVPALHRVDKDADAKVSIGPAYVQLRYTF